MVKAFPTRHLSLEEMRRVERSVVDRAGALACWRGAQPDPHLFLAAARGLGVDPERERSGAGYRVCVEPAEMLTRPGEVGVRPIR